MDKEKQIEIGEFAARLVLESVQSGLSWDEVVAGFGVASKALADLASQNGDGGDCHTHARKRFDQGFDQTTIVIMPMGGQPRALH